MVALWPHATWQSTTWMDGMAKAGQRPPPLAMKRSAAQQKDRAQYGAKREQILKAAGPVLQRYGLSRTTIEAYRRSHVHCSGGSDPCPVGRGHRSPDYARHQSGQGPSADGSPAAADVLPRTTAVAFRGGPGSLLGFGATSYSNVIRLVGLGKRTRSSLLPACASSLAD